LSFTRTVRNCKRDSKIYKGNMGKKLTTTSAACLVMAALLLSSNQVGAGCGQATAVITNLQISAETVIQVNGMSASGRLTGYYYTDVLPPHAFSYSDSTLSDAGTLGGPFSQAYAINAAGVIAGDAATEAFEFHAIAAQGTNILDLGTLGGAYSSASLVNEAGVLAGISSLSDNATYDVFRSSNGVMSDLGNLGGGYAAPFAMNQHGDVVGYSMTTNGDMHGFVASNGGMTDLGTLGGNFSAAQDLNEAGLVVGASSTAGGETHAFAYFGGTMTDLGTFGGTYSTAYRVNTSGQYIGYADLPGDASSHGFIGSSGGLVDLGTLGGPNSFPSAINNHGQVVGSSDTTDQGGHAFLWDKGSMIDLNALVPGSGWVLFDAQFINDAGRIVGNGALNGVAQTYILDLASSDHAPIAVAGADQQVECGSAALLDGSGSSDPDDDALSYQWVLNGNVIGTNVTLSVSLPLGTNVVTLFASDPCGMFGQTDVKVVVSDHTAPIIIGSLQPVNVSVGGNCAGVVPNVLGNFQFGDGCAAANQLVISQTPAVGTVLGKGSYPITVRATDPSGNTNSVIVPLNLVDTTAPIISAVTASPNVLTSVNKKMTPISLAVSATDNCDATVSSQIVAITANETVAPGDIQITGALAASVSADRNPAGSGRVYTLTVRSTDSSGNSSTATVTVSVPKGNSKK
jgi:probable HAF family extracellular repeat protein